MSLGTAAQEQRRAPGAKRSLKTAPSRCFRLCCQCCGNCKPTARQCHSRAKCSAGGPSPFLLTSVLRPAGACRVERFCTPAATKWYTSAIVGKHPQGEREVSRAPACKLWGVQWPLKSANTIYTTSNGFEAVSQGRLTPFGT